MSEHRDLIRRPTAIALAFKTALERLGYDTAEAHMPMKREPTWSVKRARQG